MDSISQTNQCASTAGESADACITEKGRFPGQLQASETPVPLPGPSGEGKEAQMSMDRATDAFFRLAPGAAPKSSKLKFKPSREPPTVNRDTNFLAGRKKLVRQVLTFRFESHLRT